MHFEIDSRKRIVEGTSDTEVHKLQIKKEVSESTGYHPYHIDIDFDSFQGFWRFNAKI